MTQLGPTRAALRPASRGRRALATGLVAIPAMAMLTVGARVRELLPARTPTHFAGPGQADAWLATGSSWLTMTLVTAGLAAVAIVVVLVVRGTYATPMTVMGAAGGAAFMATLWFASALAALTAPAPGQEVLSTPALVGAITLSIGWGALAYAVHGSGKHRPVSSLLT